MSGAQVIPVALFDRTGNGRRVILRRISSERRGIFHAGRCGFSPSRVHFPNVTRNGRPEEIEKWHIRGK
jgi:hypothetical protein